MIRIKNRSLVRSILFSLAITLLFFSLLEAILRLSGIQPKIHIEKFELPAWLSALDPVILQAYKNQLQARGFVNEDVYAYQSDPQLGYRLKPNVQLNVRNYSSAVHVDRMPKWTIKSNARGFRIGRGKTQPIQKENLSPAIHVLGDSSSFGWGVEYEEAYGSVLRERLNASLKPGETPFILHNHSMPGFSSFQGRVLIQDNDSIKKGDLVLVSFGGNDSLPAKTSDRVRYEVENSFVGKLRQRLGRLLFYRVLQSFLMNHRDWESVQLKQTSPRAPLGNYRENLETIFTHIYAKGGRPVFVSVCNFNDYPAAALSVSRKNNVPFFDFPEQLKSYLPQVMDRFPKKFATYYEVYGELMEKSESLVFLFPDNCHPNAIGHELMGEIIFQTLESEFW